MRPRGRAFRLLDDFLLAPVHVLQPLLDGGVDVTGSLIGVRQLEPGEHGGHRLAVRGALGARFRVPVDRLREVPGLIRVAVAALEVEVVDRRVVLDPALEKLQAGADQALVEGGVKNNPTIYDLYFESGYTNMDKTRDFPKAI